MSELSLIDRMAELIRIRNRARLRTMVTVPFVLIILLFGFPLIFPSYSKMHVNVLYMITISSSILTLAYASLRYLTGRKLDEKSFEKLLIENNHYKALKIYKTLDAQPSAKIEVTPESQIQLAIQDNKDMTVQQQGLIQFTNAERAEVINKIQRELIDESMKNLLEKITIEKINQIAKQISQVRQYNDSSRSRLKEEVDDLGRRGNLNLIIGMVTTLFAIALLVYLVLTVQVDSSKGEILLLHYIPRLSVIVFIEIFSFFFLRLYRSSLEGITYFQNELTNIDARSTAIEVAFSTGDKTVLIGLIDTLAKTERNFRLAKDESTPALELAKIEATSYKEILGNLASILRKDK